MTGPIGSLLSSFISDYISEEEIKKINAKINYLDENLNNFKIENYKLINRFKIRNLLLKVISEENEIFLQIACHILRDSEEKFEMIVDAMLTLTEDDLSILYYNLWKKSKLDEFDKKELKEVILNEYEFTPDLIFDYAYRVNKKVNSKNSKGLLLGNPFVIAPGSDIGEKFFDRIEKLSYNNLISIALYISDSNKESFPTYICFNFTYLGIYICRAMDNLENINKKINIVE